MKAYSTVTRARLSQTADRMRRRSSSLFSGKASARLAAASLCSRVRGPRRRATPEATRDARSRPTARAQAKTKRSSPAMRRWTKAELLQPAKRCLAALELGRLAGVASGGLLGRRAPAPRRAHALPGRARRRRFGSPRRLRRSAFPVADFRPVSHNVTMILPKTCRDSRRASAEWMPSRSVVESTTGLTMPLAILSKRILEVLHRAAEAADQPELLLVELEQIDLAVDPGGRAAGNQRSAALQAEHRLGEGVDADMLEDDVDAALGGELADDALEAILAVVDDMVGAESPSPCRSCRRCRPW